jgi:hypothetical protein
MQELMGHEDLNTTAIYSHADRASGVSPMDVRLPQRQTFISVPELEAPRARLLNYTQPN